MNGQLHLNILGTRGIPARHGGFETFAQRLAMYLVQRGVTVTVYCQSERGTDLDGRHDEWNGIRRVHFGTRLKGAAGTMEFDLACVRHVLDKPGADLVLGYNTAVFSLLQRRAGRHVFMNMDGIEWMRKKWSWPARRWLKLNERVGARLCDVPIADHPAISDHIARRTSRVCAVIPYGADTVSSADPTVLKSIGPGLTPDGYFLVVARMEPENSVLEVVRARSIARCGHKLVLVGPTNPDNAYHRQLVQHAGPDVLFAGGIYDDAALKALRFHARAYVHGHQVGGTNPSLVEALGAGNAVIAHDNRFNRWTAGKDQHFFRSAEGCAVQMTALAHDSLALRRAREAARARHNEMFRWDKVLGQYAALMLGMGQTDQVQIAAE